MAWEASTRGFAATHAAGRPSVQGRFLAHNTCSGLLPFVAYIGGCNWRWLLSWTGIGFLTTWIYPYIYGATKVFIKVPTVPTFNPVVFTRNTLLVTFVVVLFYHYAVQLHKKAVIVVEIPQQPEREAIASMAQAD